MIASKVILKTRSEWEDIFSGTDACVTPVLNMSEAQQNIHNLKRNAFTDVDGFNQPSASPRYSVTKPEIKHNAKQVGSDFDEVCNEFGLSKAAF